MSTWSRFVALWDQRESADALAVVRIGVDSVVLADMAQIAALDLVTALWAPVEDGGIGPATRARPIGALYQVLGASAGSAWLLFALVCLAALSLVPVLLYFRHTRERGGRLRALCNRARLLELWAAVGIAFHLGLAATMSLGIFPWGCLALYPALTMPGALRRWARRARAFAR
jgi:hypothetical protein